MKGYKEYMSRIVLDADVKDKIIARMRAVSPAPARKRSQTGRVFAIAAACVMLFALFGAGYHFLWTPGEIVPPIGEVTPPPSPDVSPSPDISPSPAEESWVSAYKAVLLDGAEYNSVSYYDNIEKIKTLNSFYDGMPYYVSEFTVLDLDGDGIPEVVLGISAGSTGEVYVYDYLVLRYEYTAVIGYELNYRAFMDLKQDGTFLYSSGATDNGFGSILFTGGGTAIDSFAYSYFDRGGISYNVNNQPATQEEFDTAYEQQGAKPDAVWHEFTAENVKKELSAEFGETDEKLRQTQTLSFTPQGESWYGNITPLDASKVKNIAMEENINGSRIFIYPDPEFGVHIGVETEKGLFELFFNAAAYSPSTPFYEISAFSETLGHSGFKVAASIGAASHVTFYYIVEDGIPHLLASANIAEEVDLDGDGDMEVVSNSFSHPSTCSIAKAFDGEVFFSEELQALFHGINDGQYTEVYYDPVDKLFCVMRADDHIGETKEFRYRYDNETLVYVSEAMLP